MTFSIPRIRARSVPGMGWRCMFANRANWCLRGSITINLAPRSTASSILLATAGCCSGVLDPHTMIKSASSISATELVRAPKPKARESPVIAGAQVSRGGWSILFVFRAPLASFIRRKFSSFVQRDEPRMPMLVPPLDDSWATNFSATRSSALSQVVSRKEPFFLMSGVLRRYGLFTTSWTFQPRMQSLPLETGCVLLGETPASRPPSARRYRPKPHPQKPHVVKISFIKNHWPCAAKSIIICCETHKFRRLSITAGF